MISGLGVLLLAAVAQAGDVSLDLKVSDVKAHVIQNRSQAADAIAAFGSHFPGLPVVLMGQDAWGRATFFERTDIANFLVNVPVGAIPWR